MEVGEPLTPSGMPYGVHFELDDEQHSLTVFSELAEILRQHMQAFFEG